MSHHKTTRLILALFLLLLVCPRYSAQKPSPGLAELEQAYAMHFLEPEPHMALAKYYFDHGDRIEAFYISETARRGRFEEKVFNPAFYRAFDGFDNSKAAETRLLAEFARNPESVETIDGLADIYISRDDWPDAKRYLRLAIEKKPEDFRFTSGLAQVFDSEGKQQEAERLRQDYVRKFPNTGDSYAIRAQALIEAKSFEARLILEEAVKLFPTNGGLLFNLGVVYQGEDYQKAEAVFVKAAELSPKSEHIQTWVGRFFFKVRPDNRRALEYYLNAYFLNPHAYETEFVESRISKIVFQLAAERVEQQTKAGVPLVDMLADPNPAVVGLALERIEENWQPVYVGPLTQLLGHYDQGVRWQAMEGLKKAGSSFDPQLKALLKDDDPRKRGLAAYLAVYRWKNDSFEIIKSLLNEESELVRFDAISALMIDGGPAGRQLALAHAVHERNPTLKKLITAPKPAGGR